MEFIGNPRLELWISIDVADTDIRARLYSLDRDGESILLSQDGVRARYRNSAEKEDLVEPNKIEKYLFDSFVLTGMRLPAGSRLRLVVDAPNSFHVQRNFTG
jgi:predicted acyl esterase